MEQKRLCPFCIGELPPAATVCPHCGKILEGCNPAGCLPVGTVLAGRYTVGEMRSLDGEGVLYSGVENLGAFRVTIKEYLPVTLSAERGADCILRPKQGSEVLFKTTRMDFADLYRAIQRITPASGLEAVLDVVEANNTVYAVLENLGGRCGTDTGYCRRRNCGWQRYGGGIYARRRRSTDGNQICGCKRIHRASEL